MRRTLFLALCAVFLSSPVYAQQACTEIGCVNGLTMTVGDIKWPPGHYTVQFLVNDKTPIECKGILPLKPCSEGPSFECDTPSVTIGESGCALPEDAHGLADIRIQAMPYKIAINILRDGQLFLGRNFKPQYAASRPNGPQCEPICNSATVSLDKQPQGR